MGICWALRRSHVAAAPHLDLRNSGESPHLSLRFVGGRAILYAFNLIEQDRKDARTCPFAHSSTARMRWRGSYTVSIAASCLASTSPGTAQSTSRAPAGRAQRASSQSGWTAHIESSTGNSVNCCYDRHQAEPALLALAVPLKKPNRLTGGCAAGKRRLRLMARRERAFDVCSNVSSLDLLK
jgi:hypothetical protein